MSSSGVFLRLDLLSTTVKMTGVEDHHEISTSYLNAIELLPIWIMFIDRIIDRIWISLIVLSTELLNPAQIEPCCRMVVACGSLWQPKIRPSNGVHSVDALILINDNMSHFDPSALFNRVNPDSVTICDAIRRSDAHLFLNIDASSCFFNKLRINIILIFSKKHHIFWRWIESLWYIRCRSYDLEQLQSWKSSQVRLVKISVGVFMITERFRPSSFFGRSKALSYHSTQNRICQ